MDDRSILLRLEDHGREAPRLQLRGSQDVEGEQRYEDLGEIARGGVGEVRKSRDVDLGRDVAIKVLRQRHLNSPEMLQRFVEEAQIGGQLQHPGIVPVYELGLNADQRPFFAMKLVKGETLAALLQGDPGRRRILSVFEQVCLTVAYAHSRGVVHRDLKPTNVMIGAFGEVQVVDWGFAKVLARGGLADERRTKQQETIVATVRSSAEGSASIAGSVMGTPAYMPPEQALGHVDALDARSDVFSLGAILCEMLTGEPPYVGDDLLMQASQGKLKDAHERLDQCGASEPLVQLCRDCLGHLPRERPSSARVLAETITNYLEESEGRAHRAQLAALDQRARETEARVRADEARAAAIEQTRRRRHAIAIAATLLVATLLSGSLGVWWWRDRDQRHLTASAAVSVAMGEAQQLAGAAEWDGALAAAERARTLGENGGVDVGPCEELVQRIQSEKSGAAAAAAKRRRDRKLVEDLERAALNRVAYVDMERTDREFEAAFETAGLEITEEALRTVDFPVPVALQIDTWARLRREKQPLKGRPWRHLLAISRALDPDPVRCEIRNALDREDREELRQLASRIQDAPASTFHFIGSSLRYEGDWELAIRILRRGSHRHPGDFWLHYSLGVFLNNVHDGRFEAALRHATAAIALRPISSTYSVAGKIQSNLRNLEESERIYRHALSFPNPSVHTIAEFAATLRMQKKDLKEAERLARHALELDDRSGAAHNEVACHLMERGELQKALVHFRHANRLVPKDATNHANLGRCLMKLKRHDDALDEFNRALELNSRHVQALADRLVVLAKLNDLEGAYASGREAVGIDPTRSALWNNLGTVCQRLERFDEALAAFRRATELDESNAPAFLALGTELHRTGDLEAAAAAIRKSIALDDTNSTAHNNLGAMLHRMGKVDESIPCYEKAAELDPSNVMPLRNLGWIYSDRRETEKAIHWYAKAVKTAPADLNLEAYCGLLHLDLQQYGEGDEYFERVLLVDPKHWMALVGRAVVLHRTGKPAESIEWAKRAGDNPHALGLRAWLRAISDDERFRDPQLAIKLARAALAKNDNWAFRNSLAAGLMRKGDFKSALIEYERVAAECPERDRLPSFLHAITLWKLGRTAEARTVYAESVRLLEKKPLPKYYRRLRAEADSVMR